MNCSPDPDYYIDPVLAECRERKAHVVEKYGGWEGYRKHQREDPCLTPDGKPWPTESPEDAAARMERNKPPAYPPAAVKE
ncbi:MAG: hypothetical protein LBS82_01225 [Spirochaetaceae bacterium]|nr:hypothetical protein [Spirochaetaceae bacterium]